MQTKSQEEILRGKRRFWKAHLEACHKSGYNLAEYCRNNNLIYHQLIYWKIKFAKEKTNTVSFVPVPVQVESRKELSADVLTLGLQSNRFRIEIPPSFCSKTLNRLIMTLESL